MSLRIITTLLPIFLLLASSGPLSAATTAPTEDVAVLVAQALASNPELKSSESRWQMYTSRITQAKSFDDPMLMFKLQNGIISQPFNFNKDPMTQKVIGITQQIPFWGKRDLKGEIASLEAETFHWSHAERELELKRMVRETCAQIYATDKWLDIIHRNIGIMEDFITLTETKYSVGQGVQQDIFKAQVERSKMLDMQITLEQQRKSLTANLNTLLNRPIETPVGSFPDAAVAPITMSVEDLRTFAEENRPLIKRYHSEIDKGRAAYRLAQKDYYPDFVLSFEYMQRDPVNEEPGLDMYSLGITFNLPVWRERRKAQLAESSAGVNMAIGELESARNGIANTVSDLLAQLERRRKLVELYREGIIPQARQTLESATIGYRVNKVDFLTLLDSRVTLFNYERDYYDSLADYQAKLAQLEATVGRDLTP
jgi:outer membrane protein, heavy metal efflux system